MKLKHLFMLFAMVLVVACQKPGTSKNSGSPTSIPTTPTVGNGGGGTDTSGGDLILSTDAEVAEAVDQLQEKTTAVFLKFFNKFDFIGQIPLSPLITEDEARHEAVFDKNYGAGSFQLIRTLALATTDKLPNPHEALMKKWIQIKIEPVCKEGEVHKAGSAHLNTQGIGEICISTQRLKSISPKSLQLDVLALAAHEVSHLYGYSEEKARAVQRFLLMNDEILRSWDIEMTGLIHGYYLTGCEPTIRDAFNAIENAKTVEDIRTQIDLVITKTKETTSFFAVVPTQRLQGGLKKIRSAPSFDETIQQIEAGSAEGAKTSFRKIYPEARQWCLNHSLLIEQLRNPAVRTRFNGIDHVVENQRFLTGAMKPGASENIEDIYCRISELTMSAAKIIPQGKVVRATKAAQNDSWPEEHGQVEIQIEKENPIRILDDNIIALQTTRLKITAMTNGELANPNPISCESCHDGMERILPNFGFSEFPILVAALSPGSQKFVEARLETFDGTRRYAIKCETSSTGEPTLTWGQPTQVKY